MKLEAFWLLQKNKTVIKTQKMMQTNEEKLAAAIAYLRSRGKYLLDGGKWVPITSDKTDVRKTIADYHCDMIVK